MNMNDSNERTLAQAVNFQYKARLFEMIFRGKKELLELYNAVNGSHYTDESLLQINTLGNAVYMSMHNDISFLFDTANLYLYEHQSTWNPNMPLRELQYMASLYSVLTKDDNLYGKTMVKIPTPGFVMFYNGVDKDVPDRLVLKLSDMFIKPEAEPALELKTVVLNINRGHNLKLMETCRTLRDYAEYTARVREYVKTLPIEDAVDRAVTECIRDGILAEFLSRYRAEVIRVSIFEYDEERHLRQEREEAAHKRSEEMAMDMIVDGKLKLEDIARYSRLPMSEVEKLSRDMDNRMQPV